MAAATVATPYFIYPPQARPIRVQEGRRSGRCEEPQGAVLLGVPLLRAVRAGSDLEHFNFEMLYRAWHFKRQKAQPFIIHVQAEAA